jgi:hypothetical protein
LDFGAIPAKLSFALRHIDQFKRKHKSRSIILINTNGESYQENECSLLGPCGQRGTQKVDGRSRYWQT